MIITATTAMAALALTGSFLKFADTTIKLSMSVRKSQAQAAKEKAEEEQKKQQKQTD